LRLNVKLAKDLCRLLIWSKEQLPNATHLKMTDCERYPARGDMKYSIILLFALTTVFAVNPVVAESAEHAYKAGDAAEKKNDYNAAYDAYKLAHEKKLDDPKYLAAFLRMRFYAGEQHIHAGQQLRSSGKLQEALIEFHQAAEIDATNSEAILEVNRTTDMIRKQAEARDNSNQKAQSSLEKDAENAAGPVILEFKSDMPVTLHLDTTTDVVYKTIAKLAGFNVLIDPEYKPQKISFDLKDVSIRDAIDMLAMQSRTFWRPLSPNTIIVTADTASKRKEYEQNVMKTFYLRNSATQSDLQQAAGTLKAILDISHIQLTPEQRSLTLRCTPDQMVLAQKLIGDIDKPKAEVMIDVMVMEVSRDKLHTIGINPPTSTTVTLAGTSSSGSSSSSLTLQSLKSLNAGDFSISTPSVSFSLLASDSNTKVIQNPEIRAMDSEKASLKIGDRVPIATGSYQSTNGGGVNTQFQYLDVGVNIDITPYVHSNNEVTLKMSLEVSSVAGETNIGGFNEPTIGQRRIEHEARLADGEVNLIGGILSDTDTYSMSGYPWITKIPLLKYLFGQENKERTQSEIVFAITPHIIRGSEIMDENLKILDIGTANNITYRKENSKSSSTTANPALPAAAPAAAQSPAGHPTVKAPAQPSATPIQPIVGAESHSESRSSLQLQPIAKDHSPVKPALVPQIAQPKPVGPVKAALGT
jgi:general secretion pathway protein D